MILSSSLDGHADELTKLQRVAANLNGDRGINALDLAVLSSVASGSDTINQATGKKN